MKIKSVFEKYLSNTPKYANQIQIQIQIFHLVVFQIQIQIQIQIFAYLNTNTNTNTYLTPALSITWTNVDIPSVRSCDNYLRTISWEIPQPSIAKISLKIITYANLLSFTFPCGQWVTLESKIFCCFDTLCTERLSGNIKIFASLSFLGTEMAHKVPTLFPKWNSRNFQGLIKDKITFFKHYLMVIWCIVNAFLCDEITCHTPNYNICHWKMHHQINLLAGNLMTKLPNPLNLLKSIIQHA